MFVELQAMAPRRRGLVDSSTIASQWMNLDPPEEDTHRDGM